VPQLPAPAFNVFEHNRGGGGGGGASGASGGDAKRTHFCATAILPHLALQLTPDAVYTSPVDALENAALLALLYLLGALEPDCPLVHYAPAGDMAQASGEGRCACLCVHGWRLEPCCLVAFLCIHLGCWVVYVAVFNGD
jgi:hypothetical protein